MMCIDEICGDVRGYRAFRRKERKKGIHIVFKREQKQRGWQFTLFFWGCKAKQYQEKESEKRRKTDIVFFVVFMAQSNPR